MTTVLEKETVEGISRAVFERAWRPPEKLTVSEWADKHRILDEKTSADPGRWSTEKTPYLRGIMDAFIAPGIEEITMVCSTQVGKTETILNCLAYAIDQDPGPALIVRPIDKDARDFSSLRVRPMIESCPKLIGHIIGAQGQLIESIAPADTHKTVKIPSYELDHMNVYFGSSNSPASLASHAVRYVFLDETDKYPPFSGREADPRKLSHERTRTFWNRRKINTSTPTTRDKLIWSLWLKSLQHKYFMPCPLCGHYQTFRFAQLKFPKDARDPDEMRDKRLAWYECEGCKGRIEDKQKKGMLAAGVWLAHKYQEIDTNGVITGKDGRSDSLPPKARHVGFHLNCFNSPWLTFHDIAAEFVDSKGKRSAMMNFTNSWLGEVFDEKVEETDSDKLRKQILPDLSRGQVPDWARVLIATVDVQKYVFYIAVRAWGPRMRSCLIDEYFIEGDTDRDWEELDEKMRDGEYPFVTDSYGALNIRVAGMDSGYRTSAVYNFCRKRPYMRAMKGDAQVTGDYAFTRIDKDPKTLRKYATGFQIIRFNPDHMKEEIHRYLKAPATHEGHWGLHADVTDDYLAQVSAEHQVKDTYKSKGVEGFRYVWRLVESGAANHFLDCETMNLTLANILGVRQMPADLPPPGLIEKPPPQEQQSSGWTDRASGGSWGSRRFF